MAFIANDIITEVSKVLLDETNLRWPTSLLLECLNEAQEQVVAFDELAGTHVGIAWLEAGKVTQTLPTNGRSIKDMPRNLQRHYVTLTAQSGTLGTITTSIDDMEVTKLVAGGYLLVGPKDATTGKLVRFDPVAGTTTEVINTGSTWDGYTSISRNPVNGNILAWTYGAYHWEDQKIFKSTDNGVSFSRVPLEAGFPYQPYMFYKTRTVGGIQTLAHSDTGKIIIVLGWMAPAEIYISADEGVSWSFAGNPERGAIGSIQTIAWHRGYWYLSDSDYMGNGETVSTEVSSDDAATWTTLSDPENPILTYLDFSSITADSTQTMLMSEQGKLYRHTTGTTFSLVTDFVAEFSAAGTATDIVTFGEGKFAVFFSDVESPFNGQSEIYVTYNSGTSWTKIIPSGFTRIELDRGKQNVVVSNNNALFTAVMINDAGTKQTIKVSTDLQNWTVPSNWATVLDSFTLSGIYASSDFMAQ